MNLFRTVISMEIFGSNLGNLILSGKHQAFGKRRVFSGQCILPGVGGWGGGYFP